MSGVRGGSPRYFEKGSHRMEVRQGGVSVAQLDGGDAQRPDVAARVVGGVQLLLARDDLPEKGGGHVFGGLTLAISKQTDEFTDERRKVTHQRFECRMSA